MFNLSNKQKAIKVTAFINQRILTSKSLSKGTKSAHRNLIRHIKDFEAERETELMSDSLTEQVAEEFIYHLRTKKRNDKKAKFGYLLINTVIDLFNNVSTILNKADRAGYKVDFGFKDVDMKGEDANMVYLTIEELDRINKLDKLSKEAKAVRDVFLIGCFTALRFSDYSRLTVDDNFKDGKIFIKTKKTGALVIIPVHPIIQEILDRNNGKIPQIPSQQAFGGTIKRICKKAGITETVLWERTAGTGAIKKKYKKYELVSSHTARRTGATNMYLAGIPTARIMLLTGHKTESAFFLYIRIGREENAKTLSEHPFFSKK
jgi:hypothetical protein